MSTNEQLENCSRILNTILDFKHVTREDTPVDLESHFTSHSGDITNLTKLLKFLGLSTKNKELIKKCDDVYKIIHPYGPAPATPPTPPAP